jgi:hypothetical protein
LRNDGGGGSFKRKPHQLSTVHRNGRIRITTTKEQLKEGLFGQLFLWVFELLPYLDSQGILPAWAIRSTLYGAPEDFLVIPGLLEINYDTAAESYQDVNLQYLKDRHVVTLGGDWDYTTRLWNKYFRLPERVIRRADEFPSLSHALGVHYRGTDKNRSLEETNFVPPEDFLELVREFIETHPDIETIYVASDENDFAEKVQAQHGSLRVINTGEVKHHKASGIENSFSKGDHALLDCLLLSRCKYLIKCQSALSGFSKVLNPRLEAYRVSANKLAPWLFGTPYFPDAFLPKLTSQNPECQKILDRLLAGDWTQDPTATKKYGGHFQYKPRKSYMRRGGNVSRLSWDNLHMCLDSWLAMLTRRQGG